MFTKKSSELSSQPKTQKQGIAVYWGTFDPVTNAHFDIILEALKLDFEKVIIAINDNKVTGKTYKSPGESRLKMLKILRDDLSPEDQKRLIILRQKDKELEYQNVKKMFPGVKITAIVGQDSFETSAAHCKWCDQVLVVPRGEKSAELQQNIDKLLLTNTHILPIKQQVLAISSTEVRKAIHDKKHEFLSQSMHPKVVAFIDKQGFFRGEFTAKEHKALDVFKQWFEQRKIKKNIKPTLFSKPIPKQKRQLHGDHKFNPRLR